MWFFCSFSLILFTTPVIFLNTDPQIFWDFYSFNYFSKLRFSSSDESAGGTRVSITKDSCIDFLQHIQNYRKEEENTPQTNIYGGTGVGAPRDSLLTG